MAQNLPDGLQRIIPHLTYDDAPAAIDFLCAAFGFTETERIPGEQDGAVMHATLTYQGNGIMLASPYGESRYVSAKGMEKLPGFTYVYVDDVDVHFAAAKAAGATIVFEPEDQFWGERTYIAEDLEGHRWMFSTPLDEA